MLKMKFLLYFFHFFIRSTCVGFHMEYRYPIIIRVLPEANSYYRLKHLKKLRSRVSISIIVENVRASISIFLHYYFLLNSRNELR